MQPASPLGAPCTPRSPVLALDALPHALAMRTSADSSVWRVMCRFLGVCYTDKPDLTCTFLLHVLASGSSVIGHTVAGQNLSACTWLLAEHPGLQADCASATLCFARLAAEQDRACWIAALQATQLVQSILVW